MEVESKDGTTMVEGRKVKGTTGSEFELFSQWRQQ